MESQQFNGWLDASKTVDVRSRVRGHIKKPCTSPTGRSSRPARPLFDLDPRPFEAEIQSADGQLKVFDAEVEYALAEEARQKELFNRGVSTKSEYEKVIASRKAAQAKAEAATEDVNRKKLDLEYAKITAPIGGKTDRAMLDEGNLVNASGLDTVLTTIVALDPVYVYFFVDEKALLTYRNRSAQAGVATQDKPLKDAQLPFEFGLDVEKGFPHKGMLDFGSNRIDPKTGTIEVRGVVENSARLFLPGSRVRVQVPVSDSYKAVVVPDSAILSDQDRRYVLCVNKDKAVIRRDVQLGMLLDDGMRVLLPGNDKDKGVTPDDWVIVIGLQRARVNEPVEPVDAEGAAVAVAAPATSATNATAATKPERSDSP